MIMVVFCQRRLISLKAEGIIGGDHPLYWRGEEKFDISPGMSGTWKAEDVCPRIQASASPTVKLFLMAPVLSVDTDSGSRKAMSSPWECMLGWSSSGACVALPQTAFPPLREQSRITALEQICNIPWPIGSRCQPSCRIAPGGLSVKKIVPELQVKLPWLFLLEE